MNTLIDYEKYVTDYVKEHPEAIEKAKTYTRVRDIAERFINDPQKIYTKQKEQSLNADYKESPFNITQMAKAIVAMKHMDTKRVTDPNFPGLDHFKTNDAIMAAAQVQTLPEGITYDHELYTTCYKENFDDILIRGYAANAAWGLNDPTFGYYDDEKRYYEYNQMSEEEKAKVDIKDYLPRFSRTDGHYKNLLLEKYNVIGHGMQFGDPNMSMEIARDPQRRWWNPNSSVLITWETQGSQRHKSKLFTVDEYMDRFEEYCNANGWNFDRVTGKLTDTEEYAALAKKTNETKSALEPIVSAIELVENGTCATMQEAWAKLRETNQDLPETLPVIKDTETIMNTYNNAVEALDAANSALELKQAAFDAKESNDVAAKLALNKAKELEETAKEKASLAQSELETATVLLTNENETLANETRNVETLENDLAAKQETLETAKTSVESAKETIATLEKKLETINAENSEEINATKAALAEAQAELETAEDNVAAIEGELGIKRVDLEQATQDATTANEELEVANADVTTATNEVETANSEIETANSEITTANETIANVEEEKATAIEENKAEVDAANAEITANFDESKKQELAKAEEVVANAEKAVETANSELVEKEEEVKATTSIVSNSEEEVALATSKENEVSEEVNKAEEIDAAAGSTVEEKAALVDNATKAHETANEKLDAAKATVVELEGKIRCADENTPVVENHDEANVEETQVNDGANDVKDIDASNEAIPTIPVLESSVSTANAVPLTEMVTTIVKAFSKFIKNR